MTKQLLCGLALVAALHGSAMPGEYWLDVTDTPEPGNDHYMSPADTIVRLDRYFRTDLAMDGNLANLVASFYHQRVNFESHEARVAVIHALVNCLLIPQPYHEEHLYQFLASRRATWVLEEIDRLPTQGLQPGVQHRIAIARKRVIKENVH